MINSDIHDGPLDAAVISHHQHENQYQAACLSILAAPRIRQWCGLSTWPWACDLSHCNLVFGPDLAVCLEVVELRRSPPEVSDEDTMEPRYAQNILFRRSNIAKAKALLRDAIGQSIIVCYRENVSVLQSHLDAMGLNPHIQRASYSAGERAYPASTRCLLNHRAAWERAAKLTGYSLIVEADYVPCAGLGNLPVFWPQEKELAWGYLYQGSPRILAIVGAQGWIRGHCAPTVAYVINDRVARVFLRFFDSEMSRHAPESYFNFEAHLQWWAMGQGAEAYIPMKHYGEHGGLPNTEHTKFGRLSRGGRHRADNLAGPLAFLPEYAQGRRSKFLVERMMARLYGLARLLTGRWIIDTNVYSRDLRNTVTLYWLGFRRLVT